VIHSFAHLYARGLCASVFKQHVTARTYCPKISDLTELLTYVLYVFELKKLDTKSQTVTTLHVVNIRLYSKLLLASILYLEGGNIRLISIIFV
jgi:hypothetical protein